LIVNDLTLVFFFHDQESPILLDNDCDS